MRPSASRLDGHTARAIAAAVAVFALGLIAWLIYIDNRQNPVVAACIKQQTAAIERARDQGGVPADAAHRFLANVAQSCAAQVNGTR